MNQIKNNKKFDLCASIVLFKNEEKLIRKTIESFLSTTLNVKLFLIDNSPTDTLKCLANDSRIEYLFMNSNKGFGAAHNIVLKNAPNISKYHLVLNPDVYFDSEIISLLIRKMENDTEIGMIMPKILNEDMTPQFLPKLLPSPLDLIIRVFFPKSLFFKQRRQNYVLEKYPDLELNVPIISGCFSIFRLNVLNNIGFYDERFFMYFEDFDISRRIHSKFKTIYCPSVSVVHAYERGAAKNFKLFRIFILSAFSYFNKHGWFFDKERKSFNKRVLSKLS